MKYAEKLNIVHKSGAEGTQLRNLYFIFKLKPVAWYTCRSFDIRHKRRI